MYRYGLRKPGSLPTSYPWNGEEGIQSLDKVLSTTGLLDQASYILRHKRRTRPRVSFVKRVATPTATLHRGEVFFPISVSMARTDKTPSLPGLPCRIEWEISTTGVFCAT